MADEPTDDAADTPPTQKKKPFIEPQISEPFDVLEATQLLAGSGGGGGADAADVAAFD